MDFVFTIIPTSVQGDGEQVQVGQDTAGVKTTAAAAEGRGAHWKRLLHLTEGGGGGVTSLGETGVWLCHATKACWLPLLSDYKASLQPSLCPEMSSASSFLPLLLVQS